MYEILLIAYTLYTVMKVYIAFMEGRYVQNKKNEKAIILSKENYESAAQYKIDNSKVTIVASLYELLVFFGWMSFGFFTLNSIISFESSSLQALVFVLCFIIINYVLTLPFDLYQTFNLDKRYGFSTIDIKTFILDQIKAAFMLIIFGGLVIWLISWIIESFATWWLWGFVTLFGVVVFINMVYPTLIAPIFNKFEILQNEKLKSSIEGLLNKAGLKSSGVFTIDASKRDKRLNAYFGGLGKSKRVVLFDTLVKKLEEKELLAVLGHELGHFKHGDIMKNIAVMAGMLFIMFAFFGNLPQNLFDTMDLPNSSHMIIVLFLLISPLFSFVMMPLFGLLSRYNEFQADKYGSECESQEALASALMKLADENKSFPLSHPLTVIFYHTHPGLVERLERLGVDVTK